MERSYDAGASAGARIRQLRTERGLSLSALAAAAGIGKGTLSELEGGRRNPTLETLYAVAGPLGVPLAALLEDHDGATVADEALTARRLHVLIQVRHHHPILLLPNKTKHDVSLIARTEMITKNVPRQPRLRDDFPNDAQPR